MFRPEELDRPRPEDFAPPYFFICTDGSLRVSYASPSLEQVLGYSPVKILGEICGEFLIADDPLNHGVWELEQRELSARRTLHTVRACRDAYGQRRVLSVLTTGILDPVTSALIRRHNIVNDVTLQWAMALRVREKLNALKQKINELTPRDLAISRAAAEGRSNESLADRMGVSIRTVERSRRRLRQRLGVQHVSEVVSLISQRDTLEELWQVHSAHPWRHALNCHLSLGDQSIAMDA